MDISEIMMFENKLIVQFFQEPAVLLMDTIVFGNFGVHVRKKLIMLIDIGQKLLIDLELFR